MTAKKLRKALLSLVPANGATIGQWRDELLKTGIRAKIHRALTKRSVAHSGIVVCTVDADRDLANKLVRVEKGNS